MKRMVIASFKPKAGQQAAHLAVVKKHWRVLASQGQVSARQRMAMDGDAATR